MDEGRRKEKEGRAERKNESARHGCEVGPVMNVENNGAASRPTIAAPDQQRSEVAEKP
jgi:hypothetical protein